MTTDNLMMQRCLDLAVQGFGSVAPNPMVGAVLVKDGKIISEGFHKTFGKEHAEVNAIRALQNSEKFKDSTLYVNLEPCSHQGKTPPCTDLIIKSKIKKVVIACLDSNPHVKGKGAEMLRNAGIEVTTGVLEKESRELNNRFFTFHEKHRPYVILKWAQSADGFTGKRNVVTPVKISNEISQSLSHKWRTEEQAILAGTETAIADNPHLTARLFEGKNPVRCVIDRNLKVPETHHLLDGMVKTFVFTNKKQKSKHNLQYIYFDEHQFENLVQNILYTLYLNEIQSLIVEGGTKTIQHFIKTNLWDEARIFTSPVNLSEGVKAPETGGKPFSEERTGSDLLSVYKNNS